MKTTGTTSRFLMRALVAALGIASSSTLAAAETLDRTVLPMPEPARPVYTQLDVRNATPPPRFEVKAPEDAPNVVILVQGGRFGGWALYVKDGVPAYDYNFVGLERTTIAATEPLAPGTATIRFEFAYDGGGQGKGGKGTLYVNDRKVAEGRIERTQPIFFSGDDTADVGIDLGTPVVEAIGSEAKSRFTGKIPKVKIEVK